MKAGLEEELRRLFGPLDPISDGAGSAGEISAADREADLQAILDGSGTELRSASRLRRRTLLTGAAAVTVLSGAAAGGVRLLGSGPTSAYAATPPPLEYQRNPLAQPASPRLEQIAARTAALPNDTGKGAYQHITVDGWYLDSRTQGGTTVSALSPRRYDTWTAEDGSGRSVTTAEPPAFGSEKDRHWWSRFGHDDDTEVQNWSAGEHASSWNRPAPTAPRELATFLQIGHPVGNGPDEVLRAVTDLWREQVLSPLQRAAVLRVLATVPGLRFAGPIADRSGRRGEAFVLDTTSGLPTRYTLIVDPGTGRPLGWEQMLTESAGRLNVRIPAVLTYETFLQSRYSTHLGK